MSVVLSHFTRHLPFVLVFLLVLAAPALQAQRYKDMMQDNRFNFYTVCDSADAYFQTHGTGQGSGWKGYQRWRYENESRYAPSGDRSQIDPYFADHAVQAFLQHSATYRLFFPNGWEDLGPRVVGTVTDHYAVGIGRVEDFWANPAYPQRLYLGSRSGGFWRTGDGGTTWVGTTDFLPASGVNAIAVSPTNPDSVYINVRHANNGYTRGIYRSINGGLTWAATNFNPVTLGWGGLGSNAWINFIKYHPTQPNTIFVGGSRGLFRTTNNFSTWTQLYVNGDVDDIEFHPTNPSIFYVYDAYSPNNRRNYIMRTTNGGSSFTWSDTLNLNNNEVAYFDVSPVCPNCLFAGSSTGYWKSTDQGVTFQRISDPPAGLFGGFAVSDVDTSKVLAGYLDSFFSNDGGRNFSQITYWSWGDASYLSTGKYVHADLRDAECIGGVFYVATDGFLCKSTNNGVTWIILSDGAGIRENYCLSISQSNHERTMCGSQDNGTSIKVQGTWIEAYGADGMESIIHPLNDDWMIGSTQNGGRIRTRNGGLNFNSITGSVGAVNARWVAPQYFDPNNQMTVYTCGESIHRSTDFGTTWTTLGNPAFGDGIQLAAIAENNSQVMVVAEDAQLKKSLDGGMTFVNIATGLPNNSITDVAFNPRNDDQLIVTYNTYQNNGNKVFLTTNQGSSWTNITYNLGDIPVLSVVIDHANDPIIYVGTELGVYAKAMSATVWVLYNPGLPNVAVKELDIMYGSNTLRAATWGRGLWQYTLMNRNTYPAIVRTQINDTPTDDLPKETIDQFVNSQIDYDLALTSVYVKWSINAPTFTNVIPMTNVGGMAWRSVAALPDGPVGTKVYFKVFAVGAQADTTETYKFMYTIKPFVYCNAAGGTNTGSDYINLVRLRNINNSSAQTYYNHYRNLAADLRLDSTYTLRVGLGFSFSLDSAMAWIDWDRDANFEANEQITMGAFNASHQAFGTFTVPPHAVLNDTLRLRVRNYYGTGSPSSCGTQTGEVEDYSIVVRCNNSTASLNAIACGSYTLNNQTFTSSGTYTQVLTNARGCDSTLTVNLTVRNATAANITTSTCAPSYTLNGQTYTIGGTYTQMLTNINGCDSTLTLNLAFLQASNGSVTASACGAYTLNGQTYTSSGTYTQTLTNAAGCDSVLTLNFTLVPASGATITENPCASSFTLNGQTYTNSGIYTQTLTNAAGCDSVLTLNLTLIPASSATITENPCASSFTLNGQTYTNSGIYTQTLTNAAGCDSVLTLNLTLVQLTTTVTLNGNTLSAQASGISGYQWINCGTQSLVPGATAQSFTPVVSGSYAVVLTDGACMDTSACTNLVIIGVGQPFGSNVRIWPNPTTGQIQLDLGAVMGEVTIDVQNSLGQTVARLALFDTQSATLNLVGSAGVYYVQLRNAAGARQTFKVLKTEN
jgi:hypothetical protein